MAMGDNDQLREQALNIGRTERHDEDHNSIANGGVAKQQSTKKMVLLMIARGVQGATKGGLHDNNMMTLMTVHHTTISHRKEWRKRQL